VLPAIHSPSAGLTPTIVRLAIEHRDRRGKFARAALDAKPKAVVASAEVTAALAPIEMARPKSQFWFQIVDEVDAKESGYPSVRFIQAEVCRYYDIRRVDLISARRTLPIVRPRQMAMHLCREMTIFSFPHISRDFGGRDHTSAMHAHWKIAELALTDLGIAFDLAHLTIAITSKWGMQ
jgi:hypothetical protein